jgi:hypothetical protein
MIQFNAEFNKYPGTGTCYLVTTVRNSVRITKQIVVIGSAAAGLTRTIFVLSVIQKQICRFTKQWSFSVKATENIFNCVPVTLFYISGIALFYKYRRYEQFQPLTDTFQADESYIQRRVRLITSCKPDDSNELHGHKLSEHC